MALAPEEVTAVRTFFGALQATGVAIRLPSWNRPTFWSLPVIETIAKPIPANEPWGTLLEVRGRKAYVVLIDQYVMSSLGPMTPSGLEFRILKNGKLPVGTQFAAGVDLTKDGPNTYPTRARKTFFPLEEPDVLVLQVRNTLGFQRMALGAFYGRMYDVRNSGEYTPTQGVRDVI